MIVEEVKTGKWIGWTTSKFTGKYDGSSDDPIYKDYKHYQCADCRRKSAIKENYCPSCGRKMIEVIE